MYNPMHYITKERIHSGGQLSRFCIDIVGEHQRSAKKAILITSSILLNNTFIRSTHEQATSIDFGRTNNI